MATVSDALGRSHVQYAVKVYIKNDSSTYVDYTARFGEDRLKGIGAIHHIAEGPHGHPITKSITLTVDNADRYWDGDPPSGFDPWEGRDVQIRLDVADASEVNLATFRIAPDGIETDTSPEASIKLEPLTETLARVGADSVKLGDSWYQARPWTFLVQELIRAEFGNATGDLPGTYSFPDDPRFTYPDGNKHLSAFGHPPQWDGTDWNADNTDTPYSVEYDSVNGKLYVCIAENLWGYDFATGTWGNLGEDATNGNGVTARMCFLCTDGVVVCKWEDSTSNVYQSTLYVNFWDIAGGVWHPTTRSSYSDFFSGIWWIYDGAADGGVRARGYYTSSHPGSTPWKYGTNLPTMFSQYVQWGSASTLDHISCTSLTDTSAWDAAEWSDADVPMYERYLAWRDDSTTNPLQLRMAWGNKPNLGWDRVDGTPDGYLYIVRYDTGSSGKFNIYRLSITKGSSITASAVLSSSGHTEQIHSITMAVGGDGIGYILFNENADGTGYDDTTIYGVDVSGSLPATPGAFFSNTSLEENEDIITDIVSIYSSQPVYVKVRGNRLGKFPQFQLCHYTGGTETPIDSSMSYFITPRRDPGSGYYLYIDGQSGAIKKLTTGDWDGPPTLIDGGSPPVYDAPFCADFVYTTGSDPTIYGLSLPFHYPPTQQTTPDGKYYLWQYATTDAGRIELADFTDLNKLEAVGQICTAFNQSVFVDEDGDWIVQARDTATAPTNTIAEDSAVAKGWRELERLKSVDIINYIEMVPYDTVLGAMDTKLYLKSTSPFRGNISATQLDTKERRLKMRCIGGGYISGGETRFDLLLFRSTIETRLGAAYTTGTSVTLESVYDVEVGDQLRCVDSALKTITAVNTSTKIVTIDSSMASAYPILSPVIITKANQNKWSSLGVTALNGAINSSVTSITVDSTAGIGAGNFITIDAEEMEVDSVDSATALTVTRSTSNPAAHADNAIVKLVIKPSDNGVWFNVGGHGITAMFDYDGNSETPVSAGDYVEFICPGLSLERRQGSKVIAADQTSIADHGKRKARGDVSNRFMTFRLAEFYADAKVSRYKDRKRCFVVGMGMDVDYAIGDTFTLKSEQLLPDETSYELDVIVREVLHNPFRTEVATHYIVEEQ